MSRTPIPAHLVHKMKDVEADSKKFDRLADIFAEAARPYVAAELVQEFAAVAASTWVNVLYMSAKEYGDISLGGDLLPVRWHAGEVGSPATAFIQSDFGRHADCLRIMRDFASRLATEQPNPELPLNLKIEKEKTSRGRFYHIWLP